MSKRNRKAQNRAVENKIEALDNEVLDEDLDEEDDEDETPKKKNGLVTALKKKKDQISNLTVGDIAKGIGKGAIAVGAGVGCYFLGEKTGFNKGVKAAMDFNNSSEEEEAYDEDTDYSNESDDIEE